jgi:hypothetical protein
MSLAAMHSNNAGHKVNPLATKVELCINLNLDIMYCTVYTNQRQGITTYNYYFMLDYT